MEKLFQELSIQYEKFEEYLGSALPHFERKKVDIISTSKSLEPPGKKQKKLVNISFRTVFNEIVYSSIGSSIKDGNQKEFIQIIVDTLFDQESTLMERKSSFCMAVATLQLLQDVSVINSSTILKKPAVGCWFEDILENYNENQSILISLKKTSKYQKELEQMSFHLVQSLVIRFCANAVVDDDDNDDVDKKDIISKFNNDYVIGSNFTLSEFGLLFLCFQNVDIAKICIKPSFASKFQCNVGLPALSELFIPIRYHGAKQVKQKWMTCQDFFNVTPECFKEEKIDEEIDTEALSSSLQPLVWQNNKLGYTLVSISTKDMLRQWGISMLCSNCFNFTHSKYKVTVPYVIDHILNIQLVIDSNSGFICVCIDDEEFVFDMSDVQDATYLEQCNQPAYHFISNHFASYLRMLLYLNPNYRLPLDKSYFMAADHHFYKHSKMFFVPSIPSLSGQDSLQTEKEIKILKESRVNGINNFISKYIIDQGWFDPRYHFRRLGYDICSLEELFQIGFFLNDEEHICKGARYLAKVLDVDFVLEKPLEQFCQTFKEGKSKFDIFFKCKYQTV